MADKTAEAGKGKTNEGRSDRLKAALKANMARRKAQARARADEEAGMTAGAAASEPGQKTPDREM